MIRKQDLFIYIYILIQGFPGVTSGKELACPYRRHKKIGFLGQ